MHHWPTSERTSAGRCSLKRLQTFSSEFLPTMYQNRRLIKSILLKISGTNLFHSLLRILCLLYGYFFLSQKQIAPISGTFHFSRLQHHCDSLQGALRSPPKPVCSLRFEKSLGTRRYPFSRCRAFAACPVIFALLSLHLTAHAFCHPIFPHVVNRDMSYSSHFLIFPRNASWALSIYSFLCNRAVALLRLLRAKEAWYPEISYNAAIAARFTVHDVP